MKKFSRHDHREHRSFHHRYRFLYQSYDAVIIRISVRGTGRGKTLSYTYLFLVAQLHFTLSREADAFTVLAAWNSAPRADRDPVSQKSDIAPRNPRNHRQDYGLILSSGFRIDKPPSANLIPTQSIAKYCTSRRSAKSKSIVRLLLHQFVCCSQNKL